MGSKDADKGTGTDKDKDNAATMPAGRSPTPPKTMPRGESIAR